MFLWSVVHVIKLYFPGRWSFVFSVIIKTDLNTALINYTFCFVFQTSKTLKRNAAQRDVSPPPIRAYIIPSPRLSPPPHILLFKKTDC